eukprot:323298-Chlamydomonas_euryale.AAC.1
MDAALERMAGGFHATLDGIDGWMVWMERPDISKTLVPSASTLAPPPTPHTHRVHPGSGEQRLVGVERHTGHGANLV